MIVAVTGHRPGKLGGYAPNPTADAVRGTLRRELLRLRPEGAISGMALGADQTFAEACCELGVPWVAAVPFLGQEERWPYPSQEKYKSLLLRSAGIVTVCSRPASDAEARAAMHARDQWMVDHCDRLLAVWDGSGGGTGTTVDYARRVGRETWRCKPGEPDFHDMEVAPCTTPSSPSS